MQEGFALAAAAHGDRGAALAEAGLAPAIAPQACALARQLSAAPRSARREFVQAALEGRAPLVTAPPAGCSPRALALLARAVDRELGRRWLAAAPLPRAGYTPDPGVLAVLHALAARAEAGA